MKLTPTGRRCAACLMGSDCYKCCKLCTDDCNKRQQLCTRRDTTPPTDEQLRFLVYAARMQDRFRLLPKHYQTKLLQL